MKEVFLLTEPTFFPPLASIIALYSSRLCWLNVPEMTMDSPASLSDCGPVAASPSNCKPACRKRSRISRLRMSLKYATIFSAICGPTSSMAQSCSAVAHWSVSMVLYTRAIFLAVVSPTMRIPSAKSTRAHGTCLDASMPAKIFCADFSPSRSCAAMSSSLRS